MARDAYHMAVRHALEKQSWTITHDPYELNFGSSDYKIDLGAENLFAAEQGDKFIAVEIKSFLGRSLTHQLHEAVGQYFNYRVLLEKADAKRIIFLAVPDVVYNRLFSLPFARLIQEKMQLKLLVFSPETEEVVQWIE
jgi:hypothetical protein